MLTLFDYRPSQNGWKIRVIFGLLKRHYQTREISIFEGQGQTDAYLRINPTGSVPAIQLEDGRTIAESNAILAFLAQGSAYLPSDAYSRAKVDQWLFFEQYNIEPVIGSLRFWTLTGRLNCNAAMVEGKKATGLKTLSALERSLADRGFLVGDVLSIADIAVYAYTHLAGDADFDLTNYPALTGWLERVSGLIGPGFPVYPYSVDRRSHVVD